MTKVPTPHADCHFVTVTELINDYNASLSRYLAATSARNVIISMEVEMTVAGKAPRPYGAALAVTYDFSDAEEVSDLARQIFHKKVDFAFGWVPANLYGTDEFGIFVEQGALGEYLANGLIDDVIQSVGVEQAVAR